MPSFSHRRGYDVAKPIRFREELPAHLRLNILEWLYRYLPVNDVREAVCESVLKIVPNASNNHDFLQIEEVKTHVLQWEWFCTYDLLEFLHEWVSYKDKHLPTYERRLPRFESDFNEFFIKYGIGWEFEDGKIVTRGDEGFEQSVNAAASQLRESHRPTAAQHISSAIRALSERPKANTPGAVSHATSSVECLLNDITGDAMTLGKYLDTHPVLFHPALKKALDGVYGYASDAGARHGKEGKEPTFEEAQFVVTICAAATTNPKGKL